MTDSRVDHRPSWRSGVEHVTDVVGSIDGLHNQAGLPKWASQLGCQLETERILLASDGDTLWIEHTKGELHVGVEPSFRTEGNARGRSSYRPRMQPTSKLSQASVAQQVVDCVRSSVTQALLAAQWACKAMSNQYQRSTNQNMPAVPSRHFLPSSNRPKPMNKHHGGAPPPKPTIKHH